MLLGGEHRLGRVLGVRDHQLHRALRDRGGRGSEAEAQEVHRGGDVVAGEALLVERFARDGRAVGEHERDTALDADELREPLAQLGVGSQLEEQRRGELAVVGNELVVGVDLVRDLLVAQHALGAPSP